MTFNDARAIEQIVWQMRLADYPRSLNRSRINNLAGGAPPYTEKEAQENKIEVNVNDLSATRLSHDARLQLYQAFNKPGNFFTCRTDRGPASKRLERGMIVTKEINRFLKQSDPYYETHRSKFAGMVLHGVGPSIRADRECVVAEPVGQEDVMLPSNIRLTFSNLPFVGIWRGFTAHELRKLTSGEKRDPGWQMDTVNAAIKWVEESTEKLFGGSRWAEYWSPEKQEHRIKESSGIYASDLVQTIDCWDFYFRGDDDTWKRRIIFDAYGGAKGWTKAGGYGPSKQMPERNLLNREGDFLYNGGDATYADDIREILHFQFADLSPGPVFTYHEIRSLGWFTFAPCHLKNRLYCKFAEAVFENLMMYMRVHSSDDVERAMKVDLISRGLIEPGIEFLPPGERWQPDPQMVEMGLAELKQIIADNSSSYVQNQNLSRDRVEKTKFQVMAEVNAMQTLVSSALQQAYRYETSDYREIVRRFMRPNSTDKAVKKFRERCLAQRIPEKLLESSEWWDVEPERVVGGGNKTLEMAIAQQLMEWRAAYTPEGQTEILRIATLAMTDDAALTNRLVPEGEELSDSKHAAMVAYGTLMVGGVVEFPANFNRSDIVEALLAEVAWGVLQVHKTQQSMATEPQVLGFENVVRTITGLVEQIAQDKPNADRAKRYAQEAGKLANEIKGFRQRLEQQKKKEAQNGANGEMAQTMAKIEGQRAMTDAKIEANQKSRAEKAASRQVEFEQQQTHKEQQHAQDLQFRQQEQALEVAADVAKTKVEIEGARAKAKAAAEAPAASSD